MSLTAFSQKWKDIDLWEQEEQVGEQERDGEGRNEGTELWQRSQK